MLVLSVQWTQSELSLSFFVFGSWLLTCLPSTHYLPQWFLIPLFKTALTFVPSACVDYSSFQI